MRVRLVQDTLGHLPDDAVQQLRFLQVLGVPAETPLDFAHDLLAVLNHAQVRVVPRKVKSPPRTTRRASSSAL
eukprot:2947914-Alexandrium_andersonii.AAC.1